MHIELMDHVDDEIVAAFERLIPQLTRSSQPPTRVALVEMAGSGSVFVFLARLPNQHGEIVGSATLATFSSPTGLHGWIEDVIVDRSARRQGVGKALTLACLDKARALDLREVNLTSRSSRCAANQLYQAMGFIQRETNVYRYPLDADGSKFRA
jgi:ribosomal protein S18 acetylase RimI-like enzyme